MASSNHVSLSLRFAFSFGFFWRRQSGANFFLKVFIDCLNQFSRSHTLITSLTRHGGTAVCPTVLHQSLTLIPRHIAAIRERHDATVGKIHVPCGKLSDTNVFGHGRGHALDRLVNNFGLFLRLHLRPLTGLLAAVGFGQSQRQSVRIIFVHLRILLQRLVRHPRKLGGDLVDVDHLYAPILAKANSAKPAGRLSSLTLPPFFSNLLAPYAPRPNPASCDI